MGITMIRRYCDEIMDELHGAKQYAENYIIYMNSHPRWSGMFSEMAKQELKHAENWKIMAEEFYNDLNWKNEKDKECMEACLRKYAECSAEVRVMLSM